MITKKITNFFIINFDERAANEKLFILSLTNGLEYMTEWPRDDALQILVFNFSDHGMRLATASLSVGKNGTIIACEHILYEVVSCFSVDSLL